MSSSSNSIYFFNGSGSGISQQQSHFLYDSGDYESSSGGANYDSNSSVANSSTASSYSNVFNYPSSQMPPGELIASDRLWPLDKNYLNVYFMNGSAAQQSLVKHLVGTHYNTLPMRIRFDFLLQGELYRSDIRIEFAHESRSYVGTDARYHPNQTTMWLNVNPTGYTEERKHAQFQGDVLHEFGHALGLVHAHRHPGCGLGVNQEYFARIFGWTIEQARENWDIDAPSVTGKRWDLPYDPQSIMHYPYFQVDAYGWIVGVTENTVLSDGDKEMLRRRYPKRRRKGARH